MEKRIPENQWFKENSEVLVRMAASDFGRELLGISRDLNDVIEVRENFVTAKNSDGSLTTDFRTAPKWGDTIRTRWKDVVDFSRFAGANGKSDKKLLGASLTVYPNASVETVSVDGYVVHSYTLGSGVSWATLIASAGSAANDSTTTMFVFIQSDNVSDQWRSAYRYAMLFDTSALTAGATISAATISVFGTAKADALVITPDVNIYASNPASNTAIAAGDYDSFGSTAFSTAIPYASYSIVGYNDFALNASGLAAISKTGVTKLGMRNENYDVAAIAPTWASSQISRLDCNSADASGTANDPKLVITYTTATTGNALFGFNF